MFFVARFLLAATAAVAVVWAAATAIVAALDFPKRTAIYYTEPQAVHLAARMQRGEALYPDWHAFPYVANVFTPAYFWVVGLVGRATGADLDALQRLARGVTIACSLAGAMLAGWAVRRHGEVAAIAAGAVVLSAGVTQGFGWMARPDLAADLLGFAGFLAATASASISVAGSLLAAAFLCKQPALVYAAAAAVALAWQRRWRRAIAVFVGVIALIAVGLSLVFLAGERRVLVDIFLERSSPWRWEQWKTITEKFVGRSAEVLMLCAVGAIAWGWMLRRGRPEANDAKRWLSLLVVAGGAGVIATAKYGSDLNYYLPLRYVAAASLAELFGVLRSSATPTTSAAIALASLAALWSWSPMIWNMLSIHEAINPQRRGAAEAYQAEIDDLARRSRTERILTNCDDVALRTDNPFVDSMVFKMLVEDGRLRPEALVERIQRSDYDLIATTGPIDDPRFLAAQTGLPKLVADVIASRYDLVKRGALFYYRPKPAAP